MPRSMSPNINRTLIALFMKQPINQIMTPAYGISRNTKAMPGQLSFTQNISPMRVSLYISLNTKVMLAAGTDLSLINF
jgi:hypothetical protein